MISYDDVVLFSRVAAAKSFVRAAEQLDVPTSTLSRRVARLEDELGIQLLYRTSRSVTLTPTGRAFLERCRPSLDALDEATHAVLDQDSEPRGGVTVTAPILLVHNWIGPWLIEFSRSHPQLRINMRVCNSNLDLVEEGIDVAFRAGPLPDSSMIARKLWEVSYALCAHRRLVRRARQRLGRGGIEALARLPCVVDSLSPTWRFRDQNGGHKSVTPESVFTVDDLVVAREAVRQGLGIGRLPLAMIDDTMTDVAALDTGDWRLQGRTVHAVYPASRHLSPKVQQLVDYVVERWQELEKTGNRR